MRSLILVGAICVQLAWCHGSPAGSQGVGAYAYQDSSGNRYGGTYDLEDGKVVNVKGSPTDAVPGNLVPGDVAPGALAPADIVPENFGPVNFAPLQFAFPDFFPDELRNLQSLFQEDFLNGFGDQDLGLSSGTASKTGDNTDISRFSGRRSGFGYMPGFGNMPQFGNFGYGMPGMGMGMPGMNMMPPMGPMMGANSAFAGAAAGPGFIQHQDFISPNNPNMPNVNVMKYTDPSSMPSGSGQFYSVSSKSFSSSSNVNGQEFNNRGSETVVNNNGDVTKYSVHN